PCYDYASNSAGALEAPLTLTGIANDQVVYTDNGTTTVGALAARTDARIVLDYFLDENGEPVFFFLYQDDEAPFTYPLYVPAEDDVLLALAPLTITGTTSNKGFRGDFEVINGSVPAGTKVHVRFLDIFGVNGAAVAAGTMPVGLYAGTVSAKLGQVVLTQLESEALDSTAIAALTSATVMDMRTSFITECPAAITDLTGLKAVAANSNLEITASLYTVGGSELVVVSDVTIVTMDIPAGALLHSMGPFSNTATTGWFIVLDNAGDTSLVPGQQYFFEYDNTYVIKTSRANDARFIYATQAGMPSITNGYGVTASVDGSTKYWGGTAGWGAAGSAVHKSNFSFHRWVNGVTNNQDGTYTLTLGQAHVNSSSCTTAGFTCYNGNKQGTVTLSASTVIVDTRNPEQGAMTPAEFAALYAQAGAGKLLVNSYFADGASDTTVEYLVIMPESNS
ncbi:MAG: hypothetical protein IJP02_05985, partial [Oscillospiraceae bacterium]|nr:hypothetical protein [Oscillospiraceae bacterium]